MKINSIAHLLQLESCLPPMAMPLWSLRVAHWVFLSLQQKAKDGKQRASSQAGGKPRNNKPGGNGKKKKKKRAAKRTKYMKKLIEKSVWNHEPPTMTRGPASCPEKLRSIDFSQEMSWNLKHFQCEALYHDIFIIFKPIFVLLQCCRESSNKTLIHTHVNSCPLFCFGCGKMRV